MKVVRCRFVSDLSVLTQIYIAATTALLNLLRYVRFPYGRLFVLLFSGANVVQICSETAT